MSTQVISPFNVFTGRDGNPIDAGYIYIGQVNLNPQAYPVQAYWDKSLTIPASQPIRTIGGYPSRSGTPSVIYVTDDDFSVTVMDSNGVLVFTSLSSTTISNLGSDLFDSADPNKGAAIIGRSAVVLGSVVDLQTAKQEPSQLIITRSYYDGSAYPGASVVTSFGGAEFYWDAGRAKSEHNGGSIISPTVPWDGQQSTVADFLSGVGESSPGGSGVWVAISDITAHQFGAVGNGVVDDTVAIQALLNAKGGDKADIPNGTYKTTTELAVTANNSEVVLGERTTIAYNTPTFVAMRVTGSDFKLSGGILGGFTGPAVWDGANVTPTYAVILITGNNAVVSGIRLTNVKKLGVWFKDVENATITHCRIDGNYPSNQWTEVETGHFGIHFDPYTGNTGGNFIAQGNIIRTCVQGIFGGNYGLGQEILGLAITGNVLESCWNHGIYSTGCRGASVSGNSFNRCEYPIALTGSYNAVTGNTLYTNFTGLSDLRDVTGISMRNAVGCTVVGNTIKGDAPANAVIIDFIVFDSSTVVSDNIVANNVIEVAGGSSIAIRMNNISTNTSDNLIEGNIIRTVGRPGFGAIQVNGTDGGSHYNNVVRDNIMTVRGESHGVSMTFQTAGEASGNKVRFEYDAPSAKTLAAVLLAKCVDTVVDGNSITNTAAWGTNVTLRLLWEQTAGSSGNSSCNNRSSVNTTKLAAFQDFVVLSGSGFVMNEAGNGVPAYAAGVGSLWRRKDGGAGSTLYVRETSAGTTWVAK